MKVVISGGEAAQSAILPGTARSRLCGKDGRGAVRLSPGENPQAGGGRVEGEEKAERRGGDHLLRREAGYPGDRDDRPGFVARARRPLNTSATARSACSLASTSLPA